MKIRVILGILGTALVTAAFVMAIAEVRSVHAVDDAVNPAAPSAAKDEAPTLPRPTLEAADCRFEVATDKAEYQPGDSPLLTLIATNLTNRSVESNVQLQILATEIPSPLSRVMPLPQSIWTHDYSVKLAPGETRSFELKADVALAAGRLLTVTMTLGDQKAQLNQVKVAGAGQQLPGGTTPIVSTQPSNET